MKSDKTKKDEDKGKDSDELDIDQLNKVSGGQDNLNAPPEKNKRIDINRRG